MKLTSKSGTALPTLPPFVIPSLSRNLSAPTLPGMGKNTGALSAEPNPEGDKVIRDTLKEHRGEYFVEYRPADSCLPFATVDLVFLNPCSASTARRAMEHELRYWLKRFPVPVMVSGFDVRGVLLHLSDVSGESHLTGHLDLLKDHIVWRWGLFKDNQPPPEQSTSEYLERVYKNVPYRLQREVRQKAERKARSTARGIRLIVFLMVGVPVLIEMISLGVAWLGYLLSGISILAGLYKLAQAMGWLKPSKRKQAEAERNRKMEHYFYHCELNPDGFSRLKLENFDREATEQTRKEAEALRAKMQ